MKTLKNHTILYDAECPMCKAYTHAFTATGMLDADGRSPYQQMPADACPLVDRQKAVNEIALVNNTTGQVSYGIESLFKVIANSFPVFGPLFGCKPFLALMRKVYAFISYNRKVIIPAPTIETDAQTNTPQPTFRLRYRLAYLLFTTIVVGYILKAFPLVLGQLLFQGLIIAAYAPKKTWDYLGNLMTISIAGALLLIPAMMAHPSKAFATGYYLVITALMLLEHIRRTKLLALGWLPTITWVTYRLIVLQLLYHLL